jgi:hypothetical protein
MPTLVVPEDRRTFSADADGIATVYRDPETVADYTIDWTRQLGSDTIRVSTWTGDGLTITGEALTSQATSAFLTGEDGTVKNTITTAAGRTYVRRIRIVSKEQ